MRYMTYTCIVVAIFIGLYHWVEWLKGHRTVKEITSDMVGWEFKYMGGWRRIDSVWEAQKVFFFESDVSCNDWKPCRGVIGYKIRQPLEWN